MSQLTGLVSCLAPRRPVNEMIRNKSSTGAGRRLALCAVFALLSVSDIGSVIASQEKKESPSHIPGRKGKDSGFQGGGGATPRQAGSPRPHNHVAPARDSPPPVPPRDPIPPVPPRDPIPPVPPRDPIPPVPPRDPIPPVPPRDPIPPVPPRDPIPPVPPRDPIPPVPPRDPIPLEEQEEPIFGTFVRYGAGVRGIAESGLPRRRRHPAGDKGWAPLPPFSHPSSPSRTPSPESEPHGPSPADDPTVVRADLNLPPSTRPAPPRNESPYATLSFGRRSGPLPLGPSSSAEASVGEHRPGPEPGGEPINSVYATLQWSGHSGRGGASPGGGGRWQLEPVYATVMKKK
uniref:Uncharacterized protein n=1 Tax=Neospora caninum (strain Liverpool) TaxID=572307 RepID=A0A0F7UP92_NEOCL|nr:TPA: hypothetical protein BN1204_065230 [Neospora caninum Liverpool]